MSRTQQTVSVNPGRRSINPAICGDGGQHSADICPLPPAQGLLNGTAGVVTGSMHLDLGHDETSTVLNHLPSQARHQARNEQQHHIAKRYGSHRDESTSGIAPQIAPCKLQKPSAHHFRPGSENVPSLIGTSNAASSYSIVVCAPALPAGRMTRRVGRSEEHTS